MREQALPFPGPRPRSGSRDPGLGGHAGAGCRTAFRSLALSARVRQGGLAKRRSLFGRVLTHAAIRTRRRSSKNSATWWRRGEPIIGGGAGTGLSAKCEEAGGIDLIVIYNSGRYRMAGRGSLAGLLAYGNANAIVVEMAREVLPVVDAHAGAGRRQRHRPLPRHGHFLAELKALGFSGMQNFPTVGLIDGTFRANLEETGMCYGLEVEMSSWPRARPADHPLRVQRGRGGGRWRRPAPTSSSATSA